MAVYNREVRKGDTLYGIVESAKDYFASIGETIKGALNWTKVAEENGIDTNTGKIEPGDTVTVNSSWASASAEPKNLSTTAKIDFFGLQAGTDRTLFATWKWDKEETDKYEVRWYYDTGNNGIWFIGEDTTADHKQSTYSAPENAIRARVVVRPVAKTKTVNKKEVAHWVANWSTERIYSFSDNPPSVPPVPSVEIKDYTLTATLDNLHELNATHIRFEVFQDNGKLFSSGTAKIITYHASFSCTVTAGHEYKVCCRSVRGSELSDWTQFSENITTKPAASTGITTCKATSETSVYLEWAEVANATAYEIEYATKKEYFDNSSQVTPQGDIKYPHYEVSGLESGSEYFFRVRATNEKGESAWTEIKSVVIGTTPTAPTTWSSTSTCIVGEPLTLYWLHNTEDNSAQTYAEVELYIDGLKETHTINTTEEKEDEKTMHYAVNTATFVEGSKIEWRVRTAGVTKTYGEWSTQRTVDIYAPPTLALRVTDANGNALSMLNSFPFYVEGETGPETQKPIGYHVAIVSNTAYETTDSSGNVKMVSAGDEVYAKHFDTSEQLTLELSAGSVDLSNNAEYALTCTAAMDSGLTVSQTVEFKVAWGESIRYPNAEIGVDPATLTASIRPYCTDSEGALADDVILSVYRREFDGGFTELVTGLPNSVSTYITDPHPALDYARYRIVATSTTTGAVDFYDVPGYPIGEKAVIIQWSEDWSNFDSSSPDAIAEPSWVGSLLRLPYNIDVSNDYSFDVSLVEYIGRKHPVAYYGTQRGETANWSVAISKSDEETLYGLRRLSIWPGDVYVREPSGSGYWANVSVSFSQKHLDLTIPVTLKITRVEGGA